MEAAHEGHDHASDHDVVEMSDDEIRVMEMHVECECRDAETSQTADGEQADKTECVKHRCLESDRALVQSRGPIENFYSAGHGHQKAQEREDHARVNRLAGNKHVMTPDDETEHRNGHA